MFKPTQACQLCDLWSYFWPRADSDSFGRRCGPVVDKENEPEVEWKLTYTGAGVLGIPGRWQLRNQPDSSSQKRNFDLHFHSIFLVQTPQGTRQMFVE